jgi:hypothetical protein
VASTNSQTGCTSTEKLVSDKNKENFLKKLPDDGQEIRTES